MAETYIVTEKHRKDCGCRCAGNIFHCLECSESGAMREESSEVTREELYTIIDQCPCYITKVELKR